MTNLSIQKQRANTGLVSNINIQSQYLLISFSDITVTKVEKHCNAKRTATSHKNVPRHAPRSTSHVKDDYRGGYPGKSILPTDYSNHNSNTNIFVTEHSIYSNTQVLLNTLLTHLLIHIIINTSFYGRMACIKCHRSNSIHIYTHLKISQIHNLYIRSYSHAILLQTYVSDF